MKTFIGKNGLKFGILVLLLMVSTTLIGCGGSSSTTPEPVGVTFYKDAGYTGTSVTYGVGKYAGEQLRDDGMLACISSMKVPQGFKVFAYTGPDWDITSKTFEKDVWNLDDNNFDDQIRSLEVKYIQAQ